MVTIMNAAAEEWKDAVVANDVSKLGNLDF